MPEPLSHNRNRRINAPVVCLSEEIRLDQVTCGSGKAEKHLRGCALIANEAEYRDHVAVMS